MEGAGGMSEYWPWWFKEIAHNWLPVGDSNQDSIETACYAALTANQPAEVLLSSEWSSLMPRELLTGKESKSVGRYLAESSLFAFALFRK